MLEKSSYLHISLHLIIYLNPKSPSYIYLPAGLFGAPPIRVVISDQAHGSVYKALSILGLGKKRIEKVMSDAQGRILVEQLPRLDESTLVILQAGHVSTGAFDDFDQICDMASEAHAWVHIDGAFGLWAAASSTLKHLTKGMEKADSWCADAHKTLNAPYDCGLILCKDRAALKQAMAAEGSYLRESQTERDGMFYTPDMSRRSRSVDLWVTLKYLGRVGVEELVNGLVRNAQEFGQQLSQLDGFVVLNDVVFNQCLVKCRNPKETCATLSGVQASGAVWCGGAQWAGEPAIRISCCSWATTLKDVSAAVKVFETARRAVVETARSVE
jgi:glutamate/tyrosine decarboxylase-like PLP-dependent enzyme